MTSKNLGICFGLTILFKTNENQTKSIEEEIQNSSSLIELMIDYYSPLFLSNQYSTNENLILLENNQHHSIQKSFSSSNFLEQVQFISSSSSFF